eukprot:4707160-Karenia_brevis.AAC.1
MAEGFAYNCTDGAAQVKAAGFGVVVVLRRTCDLLARTRQDSDTVLCEMRGRFGPTLSRLRLPVAI